MSSYYKKHSSEPMVQEAFRFPDMGGGENLLTRRLMMHL